jgi:hypothetical protein
VEIAAFVAVLIAAIFAGGAVVGWFEREDGCDIQWCPDYHYPWDFVAGMTGCLGLLTIVAAAIVLLV